MRIPVCLCTATLSQRSSVPHILDEFPWLSLSMLQWYCSKVPLASLPSWSLYPFSTCDHPGTSSHQGVENTGTESLPSPWGPPRHFSFQQYYWHTSDLLPWNKKNMWNENNVTNSSAFLSESPVQITLIDVTVMKLSVHTLAVSFHVSRHHLIEAKFWPMILPGSSSP